MSRVLGRVRLSRSTEESTSVERQREAIEQWATLNGHDVTAWAVDVDVSGSISPFEAPELGPWLKPDKLGDWDILCAYRLDRIARRVIPLNRLFGLCMEESKTLVSVSENIDLGHWVGRMVANVIAGVAEGELEAITERTKGSREKLRNEGRWAGGAPVYGMTAVRRSNGSGYEIRPDPDAYDHLRFMVDRVLAGDSLNSIATRLNERGVLTPQDHRRNQAGKPTKSTKWRTNTLTSVLTSPTLLGTMSHDGKAVRGPDGMPIKAGEGVVTLSEWKQLQARLVDGITPRSRTEGASLLLGVAFCHVCDSKLYRLSALKRGRNYSYYRCASQGGFGEPCGAKNIRADLLEELLEDQLLQQIGDVEIVRKVLVPGEDWTTELEEAQASLAELAQLAGTARSKTAQRTYREQMRALDDRIADLERRPQSPDQWIEQGTGVTYRQQWEANGAEGRRRLLLDSGITIKAKEQPLETHVHIPLDVMERNLPGYTYERPSRQ